MKDFNSYQLLLPCRQMTGSWHILHKKDQSAAGPEIENLQVSWKPKKKRTEGRKEAKPELDLDDDPQNKASLHRILPVCHALQRRFHGHKCVYIKVVYSTSLYLHGCGPIRPAGRRNGLSALCPWNGLRLISILRTTAAMKRRLVLVGRREHTGRYRFSRYYCYASFLIVMDVRLSFEL